MIKLKRFDAVDSSTATRRTDTIIEHLQTLTRTLTMPPGRWYRLTVMRVIGAVRHWRFYFAVHEAAGYVQVCANR